MYNQDYHDRLKSAKNRPDSGNKIVEPIELSKQHCTVASNNEQRSEVPLASKQRPINDKYTNDNEVLTYPESMREKAEVNIKNEHNH